MPTDYDAIVVGAGPAGSRTARNLALKGFSVVLLEEHGDIGEPCHCSGLVSPRTLEVAGVGEGLAINEIRGASFRGRDGIALRLTSTSIAALAIERPELDRRLVRQAVDAGARLELRTRFVNFRLEESSSRPSGRVVATVEQAGDFRELTAALLVGADGALSRVARQLLGYRRSGLVRAMGASAEYSGDHKEDHVQIFLDQQAAPGWFGWTIPIGGRLHRMGTGTTNGVGPTESFLRLKSLFPDSFGSASLLSRNAGFIPLWEPGPMVADRVILVGDAARQVKPTSGGGILTALLSADIAAEEAAKGLHARDLSADHLSSYSRLWQRRLGKELKRQHDMRRALGRLDRLHVNKLMSALSRPRMRSTIEMRGDIDLPSNLVWKLIVRHPSLMLRSAILPRFPLAWLSGSVSFGKANPSVSKTLP